MTADNAPYDNERMSATHKVFLSCKTCGHWKKGPLPYSDIIDWLSVHRCAGIENAPQLVAVCESSCPEPCGLA